MAHIFIIEDNENLREAVISYLALGDHTVVEFSGVEGVLEAIRMRSPDVIILDVMLPDGNGFRLAREIRRESQVPIIFLTARSSEGDRITGFEVGGDDYVVKPFSPRELSLRVEAVLRRAFGDARKESRPAVRRWRWEGHELELDDRAHRASVDGGPVTFTLAEWSIMCFLTRSAGVVVSRDRLLGECLDYTVAGVSERTVDTHIKNIRAKLGDRGWIETVRGIGYRFAGSAVEQP